MVIEMMVKPVIGCSPKSGEDLTRRSPTRGPDELALALGRRRGRHVVEAHAVGVQEVPRESEPVMLHKYWVALLV